MVSQIRGPISEHMHTRRDVDLLLNFVPNVSQRPLFGEHRDGHRRPWQKPLPNICGNTCDETDIFFQNCGFLRRVVTQNSFRWRRSFHASHALRVVHVLRNGQIFALPRLRSACDCPVSFGSVVLVRAHQFVMVVFIDMRSALSRGGRGSGFDAFAQFQERHDLLGALSFTDDHIRAFVSRLVFFFRVREASCWKHSVS